MTAVVLAGGRGTRLREIYPANQKVTVDVSGQPFLNYVLEQLVGQVTQAVLCVGHFAEQVKEIYGQEFHGLKLIYSEEVHLLGTGGALRLALPLVESEQVLVLNGDTFCDANLEKFCEWHDQQRSIATIFLAKQDDTRRYGRVNIDHNGKILSFDEKGSVTGPGLINAGIYMLSREVITSIAKGHQVSLEKDVFPALIGKEFYGYNGEYSRFVDIGTPQSLEQARNMFNPQDNLASRS